MNNKPPMHACTYSSPGNSRPIVLSIPQNPQADARFKLVWNEAGLVDALLGVIGTSKGERAGVAPFTVSLAVDTLLWLARGCARNARLVVASGGGRTLEALLAKDTHFPEGVSLFSALMRELALEMTTGPGAASAACAAGRAPRAPLAAAASRG